MAIEHRGFASMDPNLQREIAKLGGEAAHAQGVAHQWTSEEARAAGVKGGLKSVAVRRAKRLARLAREAAANKEPQSAA